MAKFTLEAKALGDWNAQTARLTAFHPFADYPTQTSGHDLWRFVVYRD